MGERNKENGIDGVLKYEGHFALYSGQVVLEQQGGGISKVELWKVQVYVRIQERQRTHKLWRGCGKYRRE